MSIDLGFNPLIFSFVADLYCSVPVINLSFPKDAVSSSPGSEYTRVRQGRNLLGIEQSKMRLCETPFCVEEPVGGTGQEAALCALPCSRETPARYHCFYLDGAGCDF